MKKQHATKLAILASLFILPVSVYAQSTDFSSLRDLIDNFTENVLSSVAALFLSLALVAFFYGIVEYIWAKRKGDTAGIAKGSGFMISGLIALFVLFSVYGIIKFAQGVLFPNTSMETITIPDIKFGSGSGSGDGSEATVECFAAGQSCGAGARGSCAQASSGFTCIMP